MPWEFKKGKRVRVDFKGETSERSPVERRVIKPDNRKGDKMTTPIEKMMDEVKWKAIDGQVFDDVTSGYPKATHEGELVIGKFKFKVFQLDNGQRVIDGESLEEFLKAL